VRSEQVAVLEEIFNANIRDREIREITAHFAPVIRNDHPMHLAIWGKTGTGKTLTMIYFLNLLAELCAERKIPVRFLQLDLSTPRPCFRALNDLACLLDASKSYKRGISLEELMGRIEDRLATYRGYLILFIDEVDMQGCAVAIDGRVTLRLLMKVCRMPSRAACQQAPTTLLKSVCVSQLSPSRKHPRCSWW